MYPGNPPSTPPGGSSPFQPGGANSPGGPPPGASPGGSPTPEPIPVDTGIQTHAPPHPSLRFVTGAHKRKLTENEWSAISNDLYNAVYTSNSARGPMNRNLASWSRSYDTIQTQKDFPFVDSSNIPLPYTAAQLETLLAYIAGNVYVPHPFIVTGRTPMAAQFAPQVESYYNGEWLKLRSDGISYFQRANQFLHLSLRDGIGIAEVLWNRRRQRTRSETSVLRLDESGQAVFDAQSNPIFDTHVKEVDVYVKDYAEWRNVPLKEFVLIPDESLSIEDAAGVGVVEWLYESQLDRMVRAGLLDSGEVELALRYDMTGTSEVSSDPEGHWDKDASRQIGIGQGSGSLSSKFFKNRGPMKVYRVHTNLFDLNGDGVPEENILWLHQLSQRMLGWTPYEYAADGGSRRPFFSFCPFPRADQFYGYSVIERLASIQSEMDATHNARNNRIAFGLFPPLAVPTGSEMVARKGRWYPGQIMEIDFLPNGEPALKAFNLGDVPIASWQEETALKAYGSEYTGLSNPMVGAQSSGRRSATEMRQQSAASGARLNLIGSRLRVSLAQIINFVHSLNKQYLREPPTMMVDRQVFTLPLNVLEQDYLIGVAGMTDPIDSITARNESLAFFQIGFATPEVQQSPLRRFYWLKMLGEAFKRQDLQQLIGTEQEAQQREQQQQMMQQVQMKAMAAGIIPPGGPQQHQQGHPGGPPHHQGQHASPKPGLKSA